MSFEFSELDCFGGVSSVDPDDPGKKTRASLMREGRLATDLCSRRRSLVAQSLASFLSCLIDEYDSFQKSKAYGKKTFIDYPRAAEVVKGLCGAALKRTYFFEHLREHRRAPPLIEEPTNSRLKSWAKGVHDINEVSGEEVPMSDWADLKFAQKFVISLWVAVVPHEPGKRLHSRWHEACGHCLKRLGRARACMSPEKCFWVHCFHFSGR